MPTTRPWFHHAVLYQIYPRSFFDADPDGTGDLKGIVQKLDYLRGKPHSLGVDAIWLSPFYPSPMADFGYDVADYCDVDPLFGTLKDFDTLVAEAHKRDIRVLIDLVANHTSAHHPWFEESSSSKKNPKRDWYVWRNPKPDGSPPNNWLSIFGGSAWEFDSTTGQYYLHGFLKEQPDLNWENPEVRKAIRGVMRFWLDKGVDGFRIDAVQWLGKDPQLRDDPPNPEYDPKKDPPYQALRHIHSKRWPNMFTYLKELTDMAKTYKDRLLIAEAYPHKRFEYGEYLKLYEKVDPTILAPFNFEGIFLPWKAKAFKKYIDGFQARLLPKYLPVYAIGNHDNRRLVARFGPKAARTIAVLLLSLPGIPVVYYGDELGMDDVRVHKGQVRDPLARIFFGGAGRDPERTPMQWTPGKWAGFSRIASWLPVSKSRKVNVQSELKDPRSLLNLYRTLLAFRSTSQAMQHGTYRPIECYDQDLFAFAREFGEERLAIVLNFSSTKRIESPVEGKVIASTHGVMSATKKLRPLEGRIIQTEGSET